MRVGFLTNVLAESGVSDLKDLATWGYENGFTDLEVGPSVDLKEDEVEKIKSSGTIDISALTYCRNFLDPNSEMAEYYKSNIIKRIELAGEFNIEKVLCSTGVSKDAYDGVRFNPMKSIEASVEFLKVMVEKAEENNVTLCIENCPLMGNIGISPYMWDEIFSRIDSDKLKLAYDPSHLIWQFIDPYIPILEFGHKIGHVHAKDTEINYTTLRRTGILFNPKNGEIDSSGWWRYRVPGLGELDWNKFIDHLNQVGFDGTISIEHEDPVWDGTQEKVKAGLIRGQKYLKQFI
ncbi:sugar phosphate isomerase/epimerase family protein [Mesobacillus subterraneus]|uniref:Sugar phosphate isomerase n=1 Tax=Mesobacillus subterraneus TaxID=285983 RepID=A0A0D6ZDG6_9BACI|nr:sugar phosphate isomerase/epimerase [Mesobacillus subterraneus]KIY23111.1 sugar phosphate isomerase [Mesobacillus subterraneus]